MYVNYMQILLDGSSLDWHKKLAKIEYTTWKRWTRPSFWYQDEDDYGSISPILTGISGVKWCGHVVTVVASIYFAKQWT